MFYNSCGILCDDNGKTICVRCKKRGNSFKMSWFNTDMICPSCQKKEEKDPRYKMAKEAERQAVLSGNYNFPGIGLQGKECNDL